MAGIALAIGQTIGFKGALATTVGAGVMGAGAVIGGKMLMGGMSMDMPGISKEEPAPITIEDVEAQEQGWSELIKRASGRRATILAQPQLTQSPAQIEKATLLAG